MTVDQRFSLNYSPCSWAVFVRDGIVVAEANRDARPRVPSGFHLPNQWGIPRIVRHGHSGMLFGFNHGEWGGSLLWYADNGTFKAKLLDDNIVEILPATNGFIVFVGLSHLGSDTGRATELADTGTVYRLTRSADLGSAPRVVVVEDSGTVLVATMTGLVRLGPDFQVHQLLSTTWGMFYPVSLAVDAGTAYVGMRGVVAKIDIGPNAATETWMAPVDLP